MQHSLLGTLVLGLALLGGAPATAQETVPITCPPSGPYVPRDDHPRAAEPLGAALGELWIPGVNVRDLGPLTAAEVAFAAARDADPNARALRAGLVRELPTPLAVDGWSSVRTELGAGLSLWTIALRSEGAFDLRVRLDEFALEDPGSFVVVWGRERDEVIAIGPYEGRGPNGLGGFWSGLVPGELARIEYVGRTPPSFRLGAVAHYDVDTFNRAGSAPAGGVPGGITGGPDSCHVNGSCHLGTAAEQQAFDATARIDFVNDGESKVCTGTLLGDQDPEADGPFFLTADHCISDQGVANTMVVIWDWESSSCGSPPSGMGGTTQTGPGSQLLADDHWIAGNDSAFLRLFDPPAPGAQFSGWSTGDVPDGSFSFSQPAGSWKRYTRWDEVYYILCLFDEAFYEMTKATMGMIEPGSSGCGIFDQSGHLYGQLYGHCGFDPKCGDEDWRGAFGEFENTYELTANDTDYEVRDYLAIGGTFHMSSGALSDNAHLGTPSEPFKTLGEALGKVWSGARLKAESGSYAGTYLIDERITILGKGSGSAVIGQ